jgi:hypothetical protein
VVRLDSPHRPLTFELGLTRISNPDRDRGRIRLAVTQLALAAVSPAVCHASGGDATGDAGSGVEGLKFQSTGDGLGWSWQANESGTYKVTACLTGYRQ